ncbi:MAG: DUF805 domain-containing protein [Candidatus Dormiibacterota bacterium]
MVSYGDAYERMWRMGLEFSGRSTRPEYWKVVLINVVIAIVLLFLEDTTTRDFVLLADLYTLVAIIPGIALSIRRLHDTNRTGWWVLIGLVPILGALLLIWFMAQPSTTANDRYGSLPTDSAAA